MLRKLFCPGKVARKKLLGKKTNVERIFIASPTSFKKKFKL
jgi:hypothetical protein